MTYTITGMDDLSVTFIPDTQKYVISKNDEGTDLYLDETEALRLRHMLNFHLPKGSPED